MAKGKGAEKDAASTAGKGRKGEKGDKDRKGKASADRGARSGGSLPGPPPPPSDPAPAPRTAPERLTQPAPATPATTATTAAGDTPPPSVPTPSPAVATPGRRNGVTPMSPGPPAIADDLTRLALVPVDVARRVLPERRLPFYLGVGALAVVGVVEWPVALAAGMAWEALRRRRPS